MPIPKPRKTESEQDYVTRGMGNRSMLREFPDNAQRAAVLYSTYRGENPVVKKKRVTKKKSVIKKAVVKRVAAKKKAVPKKKSITKKKVFKNPIVGEKAAPFYVVFVEHEGDRYYYGGSKADGMPIFDTDIEKAFLSHESKPLAQHVKIEAMQHIRGKGLKLKVIRAYIDKTGRTIPGE